MNTLEQPLNLTPLNTWHIQNNAKMIPFSGWSLPVSYGSVIEEHLWTRECVSIFDVCHMGEFLVRGEDVSNKLDRILTNDISSIEVGQCRYSLMLNENAGVIDDLIVYRCKEDEFMIVVNAGCKDKDFSWIKKQLQDCDVRDISVFLAKIDVQGPLSASVLSDFFGEDIGKKIFSLGYFRFFSFTYNDMDLIISRTGYTGELGYEIYIPWDYALDFWQDLLEKEPKIKPAGLGARDSLRMEVCFPLYGNELKEDITPLEAGLMRFVCLDKDFIGKEVLLEKINSNDIPYKLVGLASLSKRPMRSGDLVYTKDEEQIGFISSGGFSPSLGVGIGMAYIKPSFLSEDTIGRKVYVKRGKIVIESEIVEMPFYKDGTVRKDPSNLGG